MCRQVQCPKCNKPTYAGCGMHIEQVLGHIPHDQRCDCRTKSAASAAPEPSLLRRLFGG